MTNKLNLGFYSHKNKIIFKQTINKFLSAHHHSLHKSFGKEVHIKKKWCIYMIMNKTALGLSDFRKSGEIASDRGDRAISFSHTVEFTSLG